MRRWLVVVGRSLQHIAVPNARQNGASPFPRSTRALTTHRPPCSKCKERYALLTTLEQQIDEIKSRKFDDSFFMLSAMFLRNKLSTRRGRKMILQYLTRDDIQRIIDVKEWVGIFSRRVLPIMPPPEDYRTQIAFAVIANLNTEQEGLLVEELISLTGDNGPGLLRAIKADAQLLLGSQTVEEVRRAGRQAVLGNEDWNMLHVLDAYDREWNISDYNCEQITK